MLQMLFPVVASSWSMTAPSRIPTMSSNSVSKCTSTVWDYEVPLRVTEIHHTTVMHWIREAGHQLRDAPESEEIPEVTELDELLSLCGEQAQQAVDLDCGQSQPSWNFGLGDRRPQCCHKQVFVECC